MGLAAGVNVQQADMRFGLAQVQGARQPGVSGLSAPPVLFPQWVECSVQLVASAPRFPVCEPAEGDVRAVMAADQSIAVAAMPDEIPLVLCG